MIFLLKSLLRDFFMSGSHSNQHIYHAVCVPYLIQITKFLLSEKLKYRTDLTVKDLTLLTIIRNPHEDFFALPKIPRVTCLDWWTEFTWRWHARVTWVGIPWFHARTATETFILKHTLVLILLLDSEEVVLVRRVWRQTWQVANGSYV